MLLNNLYSIIDLQNTEEEITVIISFNPSHNIFAGHFPGNPVVPGVVLLKILHELLEMHHRRKLLFTTSRQVKFLAVLNPVLNTSLRITWTEEMNPNSIHVKAKGLIDDITYFKVIGVYQLDNKET
jgi:3-hydroxyacyl-[acyl-carrier-protein] dehydratase